MPVIITGDTSVGELVTFGLIADRSGHLRQAEVEHLHGAVRPHFDVRRFQIAVDDALLVRGFERIRNLLRNGQRFIDRDRATRDPL